MSAFTFTDVLEPAGDKPIRIRARISVLRTEDGGRNGPFTAFYRPNHNFGGPSDRIYYVGQVEVPQGSWVSPGETRELVVTFLNVRGLSDLLQIGRTWRIQEGPKHVATGEVLAVLPDAER
jgi:translation elongation factor EF-Tu-like GTPase